MLDWFGSPQGPITLPMLTMPWSCIMLSVVSGSCHGEDFRIYLQFTGNAKWGPTEEFLEVRRPGEVFLHQPAQPHMMVVPGGHIGTVKKIFQCQMPRERVHACCLCLDWGWDWWKVRLFKSTNHFNASYFYVLATGGVTARWERNIQMLEAWRIARFRVQHFKTNNDNVLPTS